MAQRSNEIRLIPNGCELYDSLFCQGLYRHTPCFPLSKSYSLYTFFMV
jgi:hypothetical protein